MHSLINFRKYIFIFTAFILFFSSAEVFSLIDSNGESVSKSFYKNKWIIVNYWADWCDTCVNEVPELNKFYNNNKDKNMIIFGINYDNLPNVSLRKAIKKTGIKFPVLQQDPSVTWGLSEVTVLPTTFIISPEGDVVRKIIGPNTEKSLLKIVYNRLYGKMNHNKSIIDVEKFNMG
ncbi:TlpA family protein disulfide reductase [Gammaproteobacteria bacterium]|nr:TlpA family protein disulfide reductase [Gammaproteobacteria bacterium]